MIGRILASAVLLAAVAPSPSASASSSAEVVESLTVTEDRVRAGSVVHVSTSACPTPSTIEFIGHRTTHPMSKGVPPYAPLDLDEISLVHDGSGVSFDYVPTEVRTWEDFELICSDGTDNITAEPVAVFPAEGEAWWAYNTYEQNVFHADPGYVFILGVRTIECAAGGTATATIEGYDADDWTFSAPVPDDGRVVWDIDIPADVHEGHYVIGFSCPKIGGGSFTAETFVIIGAPELVVLGNSTTLLRAAWASTALGAVLVLAARRRRSAPTA